MKVLVTGAGGYIGRHVVKALCDNGAEVIAIDYKKSDNIDPRAIFLESNIFSENDILANIDTPDVCLHLAWRDGFNHNSDSHILDLPKHYEFINSLIQKGVKRIALMGTMHEIGYYEGMVDENTPCNPQSLYGIAKDSLRRIAFLLANKNGINVQWIRAYYITGDDAKNASIFSKIKAAEEKGQVTFPFTSGTNKYDFIDIDELAEQISCTVLQQEICGIINCCTGKPVMLKDKVEEFISKNNFKIKLDYGAFPDRPYDSPAIWGDPTKINKIMSQGNRNVK